MSLSLKHRDLELWEQWDSSKSSADLEKLVKQLNPLIQSEVNRRAGTLARPVLETQAKVLTVKAIKNFNPSFGVKLSTHVTNQLQKLSRMNYAHQNAARIPEHSMLQYHSFQIAKEDFKTDNGREATTGELADSLKWSERKIEQFETQFSRAELLESKDSPSDLFVPHQHDPRLSYAYFSMSPRQQKIFEYSTGYNGAARMTNSQIMKKLSITQGVLSYEKNKIKNMLKEIA
jgi:DNA-directed RNA polymerase specialized sigma subunit